MRQRQITERIFFGLSIVNIFVMYAMLLLSKGEFVFELTYSESKFIDFWSHIERLLHSPNIYATDADAIFPPLAYLFLKLFAYPLTYKAAVDNEFGHIVESGFGMLTVVMYMLLFAWLFMIAVHLSYKTDSFVKKTILIGILLFSYGVWGFAFERGNLVIYAMVFLMIGLALRNSPNKMLRESALVFVAISAGFKLYPAFCGFVWIAEKRYKEAARMVVYGLLAFFVPFFFVDSFTNYIHTFTQYLDKREYSHASIWRIVFSIVDNNRYARLLCIGIVIAIIAWALFLLFANGVNWKTITLLMATNTIIIPEQYVYTYVFIIIPLICFLNAVDKRKIDYLYAVLFAALFTMPPIVLRGGGRGRLMFWIWIIMLVMVSVDEIIFLINKRQNTFKIKMED